MLCNGGDIQKATPKPRGGVASSDRDFNGMPLIISLKTLCLYWLRSSRSHRLIAIGIPIIYLRRSSNRLRSIMEIPIPVIRCLHIHNSGSGSHISVSVIYFLNISFIFWTSEKYTICFNFFHYFIKSNVTDYGDDVHYHACILYFIIYMYILFCTWYGLERVRILHR